MLKLTVVVPCYGRPQRTVRVCENILSQTLIGWEAFFIGDGCPEFQKLLDEGYFEAASKKARANGNVIIASNLPNHYGGYGYEIRNRVKSLANGEFICFVDNDDMILHNHFENYYNAISQTDNDFMYFNTYLKPTDHVRYSELEFGKIGHAELIIRTDFYKRLPPQGADYGHDWKLISSMLEYGAKYEKAETLPTYVIMGVGEMREKEID